MEDLLQRIETLEQSMREHTHNTIDSTTALPTEKNVIQRVTSAATVTPRSEDDCVDITALAVAVTIANVAGTPLNFDKLLIRLKDNGTARAITWGSVYVAGGSALPTTTVLSKITYVGLIYNTANALNSWQCVSVVTEA